jgi:hypothetical protein
MRMLGPMRPGFPCHRRTPGRPAGCGIQKQDAEHNRGTGKKRA